MPSICASLAHLHRRDAWLNYAQALADGVSLRKTAKRCKIALDAAFRWSQRGFLMLLLAASAGHVYVRYSVRLAQKKYLDP